MPAIFADQRLSQAVIRWNRHVLFRIAQLRTLSMGLIDIEYGVPKRFPLTIARLHSIPIVQSSAVTWVASQVLIACPPATQNSRHTELPPHKTNVPIATVMAHQEDLYERLDCGRKVAE